MKRVANSLWAAALPVPHVSILTAHIVLRFGDVTYWHYVSHSIIKLRLFVTATKSR